MIKATFQQLRACGIKKNVFKLMPVNYLHTVFFVTITIGPLKIHQASPTQYGSQDVTCAPLALRSWFCLVFVAYL